MSDSPIERENLTAALVREYDDEQLVEWIHALQDHGKEQEAEVERLRAILDRVLDANATREHESLPQEEWDALMLATEDAVAGDS